MPQPPTATLPRKGEPVTGGVGAAAARGTNTVAAVMVEATGRSDAVEQSLERAAEQIFLSPRVVDQRSFDELSGTLQRIVREAAAQGKSLTTTGEQVRAVTDQLRGLMRELQIKTEGATKALPVLEAQIKRVQELTNRATQEAALSKAREVRDTVVKLIEEERGKIVQQAREQIALDIRAMVREEVENARGDAGGGAASVSAEAQQAAQTALQQVEAVLQRAAIKMNAHAAEAERRTEAAATEISEQLAALRTDAARIVQESRGTFIPGAIHTPTQPVALSPDVDESVARAEERIFAVTEAARASVRACVDESLERVGTQLVALREAGTSAAEARGAEPSDASVDIGRNGINMPAAHTDAAMTAMHLHHATVQAQQVGAWLMQLLGAADQTGRMLDAIVREAGDRAHHQAMSPNVQQINTRSNGG